MDIDEENEIEMSEEALNGSSSDDEDSDEDDTIAEDLLKQVEENPYLYDAHIQLIDVVKKKGDLEKLRKAREKMSEIFPLTEELWLSWINDEVSLAVTVDEKLKICDLFESAVKDYLSVNLWVEYGQFSIGLMASVDEGLEKCRSIFERGLTAVGLHVAKGTLIWETFREFEIAILGTMQSSVDNDKQNEEIAKQKSRIINLFKRQLSIPLLDMKETFKELQSFVEDVNPNIQHGYSKALAKLGKILPYENELLNESPPSLDKFMTYMDFEMGENDPARIQCLFERAVVHHCLAPDLWKRYTLYLSDKLNIESVILPVYERAVRNCPWAVEIWQGYLRALEKHAHPLNTIKGVAEKAFSSGFTSANDLRQLWMSYLEYLRRQVNWDLDEKTNLDLLQSTFERAHNHLSESFGADGDPQCEILQFSADIEARYCKNMEKARQIWNDIMHLGHAKYANMWMEYINLERLHGNAKHTRKTFIRALQAASDWPETIGEAWIKFERVEGDLAQLETALLKISARMKFILEQRQKQAESDAKVNTPKLTLERKQMKKAADLTEKRGVKRKAEKTSEQAVVDSDGFVVPSPKIAKKADVDAENLKSKELSRPTDEDSKKINVAENRVNNERTVFLSNLAFNVTEDEIKNIFSSLGEITQLRLVKDFKGRSKGYAYVEFSSIQSALDALKKDRAPINERPVFVSKCEDKKDNKSKKQFKYSTGLEKRKLFVRGLPFSLNEAQITELFKPHGELKEVRLVTYRNGHSKGIAYVEYASETDAASALLKMDGFEVESHTISVALSNPPQRKDRETSEQTPTQSLGGGERNSGVRGHARTKLSFVPRALNKPQPSNDNGSTNGNSANPSGSKPMSNSDFRSMMLK